MTTPPRRYPFAALELMMTGPQNEVIATLKIAGKTFARYRRDGITEETAERLALRAGFHPFEVWPDMVSDRIDAITRICEECGSPFIPNRKSQKFCVNNDETATHKRYRCSGRGPGLRNKAERYANDPEYRQKAKEKAAARRAAMTPLERQREQKRVNAYKKRKREQADLEESA